MPAVSFLVRGKSAQTFAFTRNKLKIDRLSVVRGNGGVAVGGVTVGKRVQRMQ